MHRQLKHRPLVARSGISLLEVLISMFIILIGLLGVAAMLPVGRLEIAAATQAERGGAVARAGFRELKVRRLLDPTFWRTSSAPTTAVYNPANANPWFINGTTYDRLPPVVIDPIGVSPPPGFTSWGTTLTTGGFPRLSIAGTNSAWADSIFRSGDDLKIEVPTNADNPAVQVWDRVEPSNLSSNATRRQSIGDYSWLATVVPDPNLRGSDEIVTVSIAVFYRRNLFQDATIVPAERRVNVTGMLGTSVILGTPPSTPGTPEQYTTVKPGHWLLMTGYTTQNSVDRWTARWYRVVNVDDLNGNQRTVTLAGPDWPVPLANTSVILIDNVINVIEKNMRLEIPENPWKQ